MFINEFFTNGISKTSGVPENQLRFINEPSKAEVSGINLIYLSDINEIKYPNKIEKLKDTYKALPEFLLKVNKRKVFDYIIIPPYYYFLNKRIITSSYIKFIKTLTRNIKIIKAPLKNKSDVFKTGVIYDISPVYNDFLNIYNTSEVKAFNALIKLINNTIQELELSYYKRDNYLLIDIANYGSRNLINGLYNFQKLFPEIFQKLNINGIIIRVDNLFWNLASKDDKNILIFHMETYFKIKNTKIKMNIDGEEVIVEKNNNEVINTEILSQKDRHKKELDSIESGFKTLNKFKKELKDSGKNIGNVYSSEDQKKINSILDEIHNTISRSETLSGKTVKEKLNELLNKPEFQKYKNIIEEIKKLNAKYNGSITINRELLKKTANSYYDPIEVLGIETFHSYNKQKTEFDEVLDEAMFDVFKGIEQDPEAGIKVLKIDINYEDNYKSRYKIYTVKLKNTKFGYSKPYNIQLKVPYPVNDKYLKIDGNNYIMGNQFFPKPIVKIQPQIVRIYTHFSTAAVELKGTILNKTSDFDRFKKEFLKILAETKNLKKAEEVPTEDIQKIKEEYNLPHNLNSMLIFNAVVK